MSQLRGDSSASIQASFLERQKAKWKPDQLATHCDRCSQPFGLLRRKHHCRRCGGIFCDPCCAARVNLPGYGAETQRVCKICEAILFASTTPSGLNSAGGATSASPSTSLANNNQQGAGGGFGGLMSKISGLGSAAPSQTGSPQAKKPQDGSTTSRNNSTNASPQSIVSGLGNNSITTTKATNMMMMATANLPSLELFPRERRILLIGSPGVGKGSFIATACGVGASATGNGGGGNNNNNASSNNNYNNINSTTSPNFGSARGNYSASAANFNNNDPSSPTNNNNNNNEKPQVFEGASSSSLSEKKRIIPFMGLLYQLVLVNTAGSTVSSELFVHPLLTIGTAGYILMYDVTEPKSFEVLGLLQERLLDCGAQDRAMILVGSKADHVSASGAGRERVVSKDQALKLANNWRVPHVDVSCTSKESVDVALMELLREIAVRDTY